MTGTDAPADLLNDALIQRLVEDAGKVAKYFVGVPRDQWSSALVEILETARSGLGFLPADIAQVVSEQFITAVASHALELEAANKGTLQ